MPVKVNVRLSRKVTEDFQSRGFSLNIEAELPANVIEDPNAMAAATGISPPLNPGATACR
jgi:hypothetical protein